MKVVNKTAAKCCTISNMHFTSRFFMYNCSSQLCKNKQKLHAAYLSS